MKNHSPELPPVTYKEAIKLLNGLCEGLGDAMEENRLNEDDSVKWGNEKMKIHSILLTCFYWEESPEGVKRWQEIAGLVREIEFGAGIKQ